jgi:hypothetical protein
MTQAETTAHKGQTSPAPGISQPIASLDLAEAEELCASLKRITVRSEQALAQGDAREGIEQVERWVESYRRGLAAARKISCSGIDMLRKTRDQLALSLEERLRLEDEGGNTSNKDQAAENEELARALRRIDRILPTLEQSFQPENPQPQAA